MTVVSEWLKILLFLLLYVLLMAVVLPKLGVST